MKNLCALLVLLISTSVFAQHFELQTKVLSPAQIDKVIGPFPKPGSAAEAQDFKTILSIQAKRTAADCKFAKQDMDSSLTTLFGGRFGILSNYEIERMEAFLAKAYLNAGVNMYLAKKMYQRPRPYDANPKVKPCIDLETSFAYPSGHSLIARVYARILSEVYPERAEKLLARATQFSMNRVIGGVHHPSDIKAANLLGDYLAKEMMKD
jgi:acid phosphatase (class A)